MTLQIIMIAVNDSRSICDQVRRLVNQEMYLEDEAKKNERQRHLVSPLSIEVQIQEMIECIVKAGYIVTKRGSGGESG